MKQFMLVGVASAAALLMSSGTAKAQCGYGGYYGGYSSGIGIGYSSYSPRSSFSIGFSSYPSYGFSGYSYRTPRRGHYDYYPPSYQRHGNHYHYIPGHTHWHRGRH